MTDQGTAPPEVLDLAAIRALLDEGQQYEMGSLTERFWLRDVVDRVPALLAALAAARAETEQYRRNEVTLTGELSRARQDAAEFCGQRDEARAALAALRARIEALHRPDDHGPGRCDKTECFTSCVECGDDWPCATIRALVADEGEEAGR